MREAASSLEQRQYFPRTQDDGEFLRLFRGWDQFNGPLAAQCNLVKKPQRAHRNDAGTHCGVFLLG
jgi:hypothetical protein